MKHTLMIGTIALMTGVLGGYWFCQTRWEAQTEKTNAEQAQQETEQLKKAIQNNRELRETVSTLQTKIKKENDHAEQKYNNLLARIHRGDIRVSIPVRTDSAMPADGNTAAEPGETRAGLDPATVERILSVGRDGDTAIRELNQCIDQYRTIEKAAGKPS